jgi:hypothetical protein
MNGNKINSTGVNMHPLVCHRGKYAPPGIQSISTGAKMIPVSTKKDSF